MSVILCCAVFPVVRKKGAVLARLVLTNRLSRQRSSVEEAVKQLSHELLTMMFNVRFEDQCCQAESEDTDTMSTDRDEMKINTVKKWRRCVLPLVLRTVLSSLPSLCHRYTSLYLLDLTHSLTDCVIRVQAGVYKSSPVVVMGWM